MPVLHLWLHAYRRLIILRIDKHDVLMCRVRKCAYVRMHACVMSIIMHACMDLFQAYVDS